MTAGMSELISALFHGCLGRRMNTGISEAIMKMWTAHAPRGFNIDPLRSETMRATSALQLADRFGSNP
jgi:hypothetical protein